MGIIILCIVVGVIIYGMYNKDDKNECVVNISDNNKVEETKDNIEVYVVGCVNKPGVYEVTSESNVSDAIELAGGLSTNAVTTNINLSKKLTSEMVIYVFNKNEFKVELDELCNELEERKKISGINH